MRGKVNEMLRKVTAGTVAVVLLSFLAGTLSAQVGTRVGNFMYKGNAVRLNGRTIDVSDSMTAISSTFWSDVSRDSFVVNNETPSIMFVIDNSGSMGVNTPHNDPQGQRFIITRQFLDTIYKKYPAAEVGLAVFGTHLYFDTLDKATHPYFTQTNPLYQHDPAGTNRGAYIRLLRLDSTYVNYGNLTGYTILRNILDTAHYTGRDFNNNNYNFVGLKYLPTTVTLGGLNDAQGWPYTNITAGFDAAKSAMDEATASRCSRYIIFLSDGIANRPTGAAQNYYRDNVTGVPTTFTVFFPAGAVPPDINTMTNHIRVNGYDLSRPADSGCQGKSNYWSANAGDLMGTLSHQIWDLITTSTQTRPASIIVNGFTTTQRLLDSFFIFNNYIPLTGQITPVSVSTTYNMIVNNVSVGDTTITVSYNVRTMPHGNPTFPNWNPSKADSFQVWTWDRDFSFRYNSVRHDTITGTMDSVELYFTFDSGTAKYGYDNVYIDLYNNIAPIDHQRIQLTRVSDRVFSGKFKRQVLATANVDELPALLQYRGANDSIIAVFRNREQLTTGHVQLPLDTLRKSIGFVNVTMNIAVNDTIITAGDTTNRIKIASSYVGDGAVDSTWIKNNLTYLQLPLNKRPGDTVVRTIGQWARFTGTMADTVNARRIECALYLPDGQVLRDTILVRIKPAAASRLFIEADNTPDPYVTNPFGVMTFTSTMTLDSAWAVLRDKYNNLVSFSTSTAWLSRNTTVVTVTNGNQLTGEGVVTKGALVASTWVLATNNVNTSLRDSIPVVITDISYDSLMILRYIGGTLTPIYNLRDTIPNASTIYVQAHRADGLGGHNGWGNDVAGTWSLSASLSGKTSSLPPSSSNSWTFTPNDTGTGTISVSLAGVSTPATLNPVVFVVGAPNLIYIYPVSGTPNVPGNTVYPAAPSVIDTMCSDSAFSRLVAKLFYRTAGGKEIWLSTGGLDNPTLGSQITWSANGTRDTMTPTYGNFSTLTARQAYRVSTVTARWNALSYSVNIYIESCNPDHIVIEATPVVVNLIADDPVAQLAIQSSDTFAVAYARIRDHFGNYISPSINSTWSSSNNAVIIGRKGDPATGQGIAVRRADGGSALLIASDAVARPGITMRDSVLVNLSIIYYQDLRIYTLVPSYNPNVDTVTIPIAGSLTLYAEGQRSDDPSRWEAVMVRWGKDMTLNTVTNPSGTPAFSWTVIPSTIGNGRIRAAFSQTGYQDLHDSVWAVFTEGPADGIALYQSLGNPAVVPVFPAIDTIAAGSTDSVFAKIFDRTGQWLRRFEDTVALAQATISWTLQRVSGTGNDPLNILTGRMTTFSPHTAFTTYRVTATFSQSGTIRTASALIYVSCGVPDHIVIEAQTGPAVVLSVADNPLPQVSLGPYDTIYTQVYAIIRDRDGNFYSYSHNPDWWSDSISIVTAVRNPTAWQSLGQGLIMRVTPNTGSTFVMAMDLDYPSLRLDSVPVVLGSVPYDSLRITLRHPTTWMDTVEIHGIVYMQSGDANTFYVQARRAVVNTWEDVSSDWRYVATLGSITGPTAHGWPFTAVDTAHYGIMTATFGSLSASITIAIDAGVADTLVLYTDSLPPGAGNVVKVHPPLFETVAAGSRDTVAALVFDSRGVFLPQYLTGPERLTISWTATSRSQAFLNEDLSAKLLGAPGPVKYFAPTRAYDTVLIVATLNTLMRDSVLVVVQPGPAYHIVLEKTAAYDLHVPNSCDTLTIQENEQGKSVYAILRDQYNNAVAPTAYATLMRDSVRSVSGFIGVNIPGTIGQLQVQRLGLSDSGMIYAWDSHGFSDSCVVILRPYRIIALRIVSAPGMPYADGYTLTMTNNDSAAIYVEGQRSDDTTVWVSVEATWEIQPRIQPILPGNGRYSQSFMVSPTDTGTGWIRVTKGNYDQTTPDTLPLHFTGGGAVRAKITILTPAAQRIAGQPIVAVDSLFDQDNHLIRSLPPVTAAYHDTIGRGGLMRPAPFMLVPGRTDTVWLDQSPWDFTSQTFTGGVSLDTFTLYYAPAAPVYIDSMHRIYASFTTGGRVLPAQTESFILLPGPLTSIIMESNGVPIVDTIKLYYGGGQTSENIFTRGYDPYNNNLGFVPTVWSVSDSLHPIAYYTGNSVTNVNYSTTDPTFTGRDEGGWIRAQAPSNPAIYDRVPVVIFGPLIRLDSAITGDWSGNGLLDHMTLHFSRPFVPQGPDFEGLSIKLSGTAIDFTPDTASYAILNNTGSSSAIWVLSFVERDTTSPQTGWTPRVHINTQQNVEGRVIVDSTTITSLDGAGPVIWSVVNHKYSNTTGDRTRDTVIVTFSEPVKRRSDHNDLQQGDLPGDIFHVWTDSTGTVMSDNFKLVGINNQFTMPTPVGVTFLMLNGNDLNGRNLLNIDSVNKYVVDAVPGRYNAPNDNNQKVRVVVVGKEGPLLPIPNPASPYVGYPGNGPGQFNMSDNTQAPGWADVLHGGHGGVALSFDFPKPVSGVALECWIKIYDMVGNVVQAGLNRDYLSTITNLDNQGTSTGLITSYLYWNGTNARGMVVAPGVYRIVLYLHFRDEVPGSGLARQYADEKKVSQVGISR